MNELLSCEALTKCYQKDKAALENVDLHIGFGRIVGLLGPNGSGKTTLIKLANGLLQPSAGSIRIAGMTPGPDTKAIVSYLPDADWLPDWMRVEQLVEMFHEFYADFDPAKANEMLARLELEPKARLKTLSKGSKEKVQLILPLLTAALDSGEKLPAPPMVKMKRPTPPKPAPIGDRYVCSGCGYEYVPELGDEDGEIAPGTLFEQLPAEWVCPECAETKDQFVKA